jgi:hypothetical protein
MFDACGHEVYMPITADSVLMLNVVALLPVALLLKGLNPGSGQIYLLSHHLQCQ